MGHQRKIYGEGDDSWWLYRDDAGQVFILQENDSTEINRWEISTFLSGLDQGAKHQALICLN